MRDTYSEVSCMEISAAALRIGADPCLTLWGQSLHADLSVSQVNYMYFICSIMGRDNLQTGHVSCSHQRPLFLIESPN